MRLYLQTEEPNFDIFLNNQDLFFKTLNNTSDT